MKMKALSGHKSVGIMPQGVTACAVPWPSNPLFFLPAVLKSGVNRDSFCNKKREEGGMWQGGRNKKGHHSGWPF
ncbi:hypothetical protein [Pseudomonas putida]|uniref:hypothetical protein n=1 Tax=Pseudomonas putida TaxID=303 RepID=UPI003D998D1E